MRNDTEILKALEICSSETRTLRCEDCPYHNDTDDISCSDQICKDAIELIKKQRAEIELLQKELILTNNALLNITYIANRFPQTICDHCRPDFNRNNLPVNVWEAKEGYAAVDALVDQIVKETRCND